MCQSVDEVQSTDIVSSFNTAAIIQQPQALRHRRILTVEHLVEHLVGSSLLGCRDVLHISGGFHSHEASEPKLVWLAGPWHTAAFVGRAHVTGAT